MEPTALPAHTALVAHSEIAPDEMRDFFDRYFPMLGEFTESVGVTPRAARAYYFRPPADTVDLAAGFVIADGDIDMVEPLVGDIGDERVSLHRFEAMEVFTKDVTGPYEELGNQWETFMAETGHTGGFFFEEYVTMPGGPEEPVTRLFIAPARPR